MLAFDEAIREGASGIEFDVRLTRDGVYCVMHDRTVDRTTNGRGAVQDLEWPAMAELDAGAWRGPEFAGSPRARVPKAEDVLDQYGRAGVLLIAQLYDMKVEEKQKFVKMARDRELLDRVIFFTAAPDLSSLLAFEPKAMVMNDGLPLHPAYGGRLEQAEREGWTALSWTAELITRSLVEDAHAAGLLVQASFLRGRYVETVTHLADLGVDMILGNDCAAMVGARNAHNRSA